VDDLFDDSKIENTKVSETLNIMNKKDVILNLPQNTMNNTYGSKVPLKGININNNENCTIHITFQ